MILLLQQMMMYIYLRFVQVIEGLNVGDDTIVALDDDVHFVRHFEQGLGTRSVFANLCKWSD